MPTKEEIYKAIQKFKNYAINDAVQIGLLEQKDASKKNIFRCKLKPHVSNQVSNASTRKKNKFVQSHTRVSSENTKSKRPQLSNILLKNYADIFENKTISETSPYVEIFTKKTRFVVKKTSLCWFLRKDSQKISADRLQRVMARVNEKPKNSHSLTVL